MSGAFAAILPYFPDVGEPAPPSYSTEGLEPLSYELDPNGTGKSVYNPPRPDGKRSEHYDKLYQAREEDGGKPWWDLHIYHSPTNPKHIEYAHKLYEAIRREFPEFTTYRFFDTFLGPHGLPMFEVNVKNPHQLGAALSWLCQNRGVCSVLIHPNTGDDVADHSRNASWMGPPMPLDLDLLRAADAYRAAQEKEKEKCQ